MEKFEQTFSFLVEPKVPRTLRGVRRAAEEEEEGVQTPGGFARIFFPLYRFERSPARAKRSEAPPPSEARLYRAKRGSTEAPPSEARPREGHREVAITKKLKKVPPESPGEPLIFRDFRMSRIARVRFCLVSHSFFIMN